MVRIVFGCFVLVVSCTAALEFNDESLVLTAINHNQAYALFNFTTVSSDLGFFANHHHILFPRSVGEIVRKYNVAEFHLTMTQGLWRYETWGYPYSPAPSGAQLWVWFHPDTKNVDDAWKGFTNALSGLLCASLNFIGKTETVSPKLSFRPEGAVSDDSRNLLRYALLSQETVCTENLTPWLKLLPCGSNSGISSLLNPARLHHSQYLSLGMHFERIIYKNEQSLKLHQSVSTVFDLRISPSQKPDFNLGNLLQKKIRGACSLSQTSLVKMKVPKDAKLHPTPTYMDNGFTVYDLKQEQNLQDIQVVWEKKPEFEKSEIPPLVVHCHLMGFGHLDGGVRCRLHNSADRNISVVVMQAIPWFFQVYLHTLEVTDQDGSDLQKSLFTFTPAKIRTSPHFMEFVLTVPPTSTAEIAIKFTRGFLTWLEYPPNANHGFYIGSTVVSVKKGDIKMTDGMNKNDEVHRIYTESLQVHIPVPDFSMPYNVICLACTVIAIAFGSLHNLTTRTFQKVDPDSDQNTLLKKILRFPKYLLERKKRGEEAEERVDR